MSYARLIEQDTDGSIKITFHNVNDETDEPLRVENPQENKHENKPEEFYEISLTPKERLIRFGYGTMLLFASVGSAAALYFLGREYSELYNKLTPEEKEQARQPERDAGPWDMPISVTMGVLIGTTCGSLGFSCRFFQQAIRGTRVVSREQEEKDEAKNIEIPYRSLNS